MGFGLATAQAERVVAGGKDDRGRRVRTGGAAAGGGLTALPSGDGAWVSTAISPQVASRRLGDVGQPQRHASGQSRL